MKPEVKKVIDEQFFAWREMNQIAKQYGLRFVAYGVSDILEALQNCQPFSEEYINGEYKKIIDELSLEDLKDLSYKCEAIISESASDIINDNCYNFILKKLKQKNTK